MNQPIPVFYDRHQSVTTTTYSPSSRKPAEVVRDWEIEFGEDIETHIFTPATRADLCRAHDPGYVDGVLACQIENGFGNHDPAVASSLRYTVGSMAAAAKYAVEHRTVACSPTSGFHHAHHAHGEGFCTFNGLIVTLLKLKALWMINRALILDMDQHYGNGTQDIMDRLGLDWIVHWTHTRGLIRDPEDIEFSARGFGRRLQELMAHNPVDIILFQAGADAHIEDPLGGYLTTQQMHFRDHIVFFWTSKLEVPTVWNLAGGYQQDERGGIEAVLDLHRNTMSACIHHYTKGLDHIPQHVYPPGR